MLSLFSRNLFINVIILAVFTVALHVKLFITPVVTPVELPLFESISAFLNSSSYVQSIITIVLVLAQALLLSRYITIHRLSRALSLIPGAVFVLFVYSVLEPDNFNIILLANFFFVLSLGSLFQIYKKHQPIAALFNSGFFLGMASIIYTPYFIFLIALIIGLYNLRNFNLKEFLQIFFGLVSVLFLSGVFAFYHDKLGEWNALFINSFSIPDFDFSSIHIWVKPLILLVTILVILAVNNTIRKKKKYDAIRKIELTYSLCLLGFLSIFMVEKINLQHLMIMSVPISILGGMVLEQKEYYYLKEFIFLLLIGFFLALSYGYIG